MRLRVMNIFFSSTNNDMNLEVGASGVATSVGYQIVALQPQGLDGPGIREHWQAAAVTAVSGGPGGQA